MQPKFKDFNHFWGDLKQYIGGVSIPFSRLDAIIISVCLQLKFHCCLLRAKVDVKRWLLLVNHTVVCFHRLYIIVHSNEDCMPLVRCVCACSHWCVFYGIMFSVSSQMCKFLCRCVCVCMYTHWYVFYGMMFFKLLLQNRTLVVIRSCTAGCLVSNVTRAIIKN